MSTTYLPEHLSDSNNYKKNKLTEFRLLDPSIGEEPRLSNRNDNELDKEKLEQLFNTYNKVNIGIEIPGVRFTNSDEKIPQDGGQI